MRYFHVLHSSVGSVYFDLESCCLPIHSSNDDGKVTKNIGVDDGSKDENEGKVPKRENPSWAKFISNQHQHSVIVAIEVLERKTLLEEPCLHPLVVLRRNPILIDHDNCVPAASHTMNVDQKEKDEIDEFQPHFNIIGCVQIVDDLAKSEESDYFEEAEQRKPP